MIPIIYSRAISGASYAVRRELTAFSIWRERLEAEQRDKQQSGEKKSPKKKKKS